MVAHELNRFILTKVKLEDFKVTRTSYRFLTRTGEDFMEGNYFYWSEMEKTVVKRIESYARDYGADPLTMEDIALVYSVVANHQRKDS